MAVALLRHRQHVDDLRVSRMMVVVADTTTGDEGGGGVSGFGSGTRCCSGQISGVSGLVSGQSCFSSDFISVLGARLGSRLRLRGQHKSTGQLIVRVKRLGQTVRFG
ncbi:hypothetical protein Hanom_Chr08g00729051 [Helianthus anomalus]